MLSDEHFPSVRPGGTRTDEMATGARCGGERQGIDGIRQLLHFADSAEMPRPPLLPVISGQPCAPGDLLTEPVTAASLTAHAGGAGHG
jgi:capsular polysaccharide biosynthesis protein